MLLTIALRFVSSMTKETIKVCCKHFEKLQAQTIPLLAQTFGGFYRGFLYVEYCDYSSHMDADRIQRNFVFFWELSRVTCELQ